VVRVSEESDLLDEEMDPAVVPAAECEGWKQECKRQEHEISDLNNEIKAMKKKMIKLEEDNKEVKELRILNQKLQEQILHLLETGTFPSFFSACCNGVAIIILRFHVWHLLSVLGHTDKSCPQAGSSS